MSLAGVLTVWTILLLLRLGQKRERTKEFAGKLAASLATNQCSCKVWHHCHRFVVRGNGYRRRLLVLTAALRAAGYGLEPVSSS